MQSARITANMVMAGTPFSLVPLHFFKSLPTWCLEKISDCSLLATARTLSFITAACIGSSVPLVFSERNDPVHDPKTKIERFLRLICFHACDRVVFQTEDAKNFFPSSI